MKRMKLKMKKIMQIIKVNKMKKRVYYGAKKKP
jgi:hypothetical protein